MTWSPAGLRPRPGPLLGHSQSGAQHQPKVVQGTEQRPSAGSVDKARVGRRRTQCGGVGTLPFEQRRLGEPTELRRGLWIVEYAVGQQSGPYRVGRQLGGSPSW